MLSVFTSNSDFKKTQKIRLFQPFFPERFHNSNNAVKWLNTHITEFDLIVLNGVWTLLFYRSVRVAIKNKVDYTIWPHGSSAPFELKRKKAIFKKILGRL